MNQPVRADPAHRQRSKKSFSYRPSLGWHYGAVPSHLAPALAMPGFPWRRLLPVRSSSWRSDVVFFGDRIDATLSRGRWAISKVARSIDDGTLTLARHWTRSQKCNVKLWMRRIAPIGPTSPFPNLDLDQLCRGQTLESGFQVFRSGRWMAL